MTSTHRPSIPLGKDKQADDVFDTSKFHNFPFFTFCASRIPNSIVKLAMLEYATLVVISVVLLQPVASQIAKFCNNMTAME